MYKTLYLLSLILCPQVWGQSCATATMRPVSVDASTASANSPVVVNLLPAVAGKTIYVCSISIPMSGLVTALQLQQQNGSSNTAIGHVWAHAGVPDTALNGTVNSGNGNGLGLSVNAAVSGGGYITFYLN